MTEREKIIEILKQTSDLWKEEESHGYIVSVDLEKIADALIEAGIGDVSWWERKCKLCEEDWFLQKKQIEHYAESYKEMLQEDLDKYKHRAEVAEKECNEWKERAERMHKEALKQKQRVLDSKHSEDTMRNQIECAMSMVSEMEHAKRTLEILYMSGVITEEALRDAEKQAKLEIEEEEADDR